MRGILSPDALRILAQARRSCIVLPAFLLLSCGVNGTPHFQSKKTGKRLKLTVERPDDGTMDATAQNAPEPGSTEEEEVLDSLYEGGSDAEGSETTPSGSSDGGSESLDGTSDGTGDDATSDGSGDSETGDGGAIGSEPGLETGTSSGDDAASGSSDSGGSEGSQDGSDSSDGSGDSSDGEESWNWEETKRPNRGEIRACAKLNGVSAQHVVIAGNKKHESITAGSVVAIKLAGNQTKLQLDLQGEQGVRVAGLCLFLTGNQAKAEVTSTLGIGRITYIGRGNRSNGVITIEEGGALDHLIGDLAGNQSHLTLQGDGDYPCPSVRLRGNGTKFDCR